MNERLSVTVDKVTKKTESTKTPDPAGGRIRKTTWPYKMKDAIGAVHVTIKANRDLRMGEDDHVDVDVSQRTWQAPLPKTEDDFPAKVRAAVRPGLEKIHAEAKAGKHGPMFKAAAEKADKERDTLIPASLPPVVTGEAYAAIEKKNAEVEADRRRLGTDPPKSKKRRRA